MINENNKHTWCINAEHSLTVGTSGDVRICCMVEESLKDDDGKYFNVESNSLQEIFNSKSLNTVRENLRLGIKDPGCKKCWNEEEAGRDSKRTRDNKFKNFSKDGDIKILELNLGNTCNIKCRTCGPYSSSTWIREFYDTKFDNKQNVPWEKYLKNQTKFTVLYDSDSPFWESVYSAAPDVEYLDFYGGEPFLIKKQWVFIKHCAEKGYSKNQTLHYNTNCTIWPSEYIDYLKQFKNMDLAFSIDGIDEHANYIRYPSVWKEVDNNVNRWYEYAVENKQKTSLCVCMTLSSLNIFYVDRMISYVEEKNEYFKNNILTLYLNLVHGPAHYNIQYIPDYYKKEVTEKLTPFIHKNHYLESILQFMNNGSYNEIHWNEFKKQTKIADEYRNQSFKSCFPEIYQLMESNGDV